MINLECDVVVVGSGFGGSLLSMVARRLGRSVVLLERGRHPRFAIGESSTPLANLLLEELARRYDLPAVQPLAKWGTWQAARPRIACGLKRGFTFFHHAFDQPWEPHPARANELLVAASPNDEVADTHWYRPDFDHFLVCQAQRLGIPYYDDVQISAVETGPGGVVLDAQRFGLPMQVRAGFLMDATGADGELRRALGVPATVATGYPGTESLYTHFLDVPRWGDQHPVQHGPGAGVPYPVDDAAVHHLFPGGWIWVLRFNNGLTSAGAVVTARLAQELHLAEGAPAWDRLLARLPSVRAQFAGAIPARPFVHSPRLAFRCDRVAGPGWALLPSAAGFVDPMLSTGFPLTLLGIERLAAMLERGMDSPALQAYQAQTLRELDLVGRLVSALFRHLDCFPAFAALTRLYFAAASFSETARRLDRPELAGPTFLAADHARFGPALLRCLDLALQPGIDPQGLAAAVSAAIEPIDVAGLGRSDRRNWHPVDLADLLGAGEKLGASRPEIERMLARCGIEFCQPAVPLVSLKS